MARKSPIKIGIIGCDSFHTKALFQQFQKTHDLEVVWVDTTIRSEKQFSKNRHKIFKKEFLNNPKFKNVDLKTRPYLDGYCILNVDAEIHLNILRRLPIDKPIFIDKPLTLNLRELSEFRKYKVMSGSAFRFFPLLNTINLGEEIIIEGPLSFESIAPGYFWYGIHLVEILHTLGKAEITVNNVEILDEYELVFGTIGFRKFILKGIKRPISTYTILTNGKEYNFDNYDFLYKMLAHSIRDHFLKPQFDLNQTEEVLRAVININEIRKSSL